MKKLFSKICCSSLLLLFLTKLSANETMPQPYAEDCMTKYQSSIEIADTILVAMDRQEYGNVFEYNELLKVSVEISKGACSYDVIISNALEGLENSTYSIDSVLNKIDN